MNIGKKLRALIDNVEGINFHKELLEIRNKTTYVGQQELFDNMLDVLERDSVPVTSMFHILFYNTNTVDKAERRTINKMMRNDEVIPKLVNKFGVDNIRDVLETITY